MARLKLIIFDLDGVLIETKSIHYKALNEALGSEYSISWNEHLSTYDGLKTSQKLQILSQKKGLPVESHSDIWKTKQLLTLQILKQLEPNENFIKIISMINQTKN